jgi:hypothetical protein
MAPNQLITRADIEGRFQVGRSYPEYIGDVIGQLAEFLVAFAQGLFRLPGASDIETGTDVTGEPAVQIIEWFALIEQPAIFSIVPAQAVFEGERLARTKCPEKIPPAIRHILRVNSMGPAIAQFLGQAAAREFQPGLVKVIAFRVCVRTPDERGKCIQECQLGVTRRLDGVFGSHGGSSFNGFDIPLAKMPARIALPNRATVWF